MKNLFSFCILVSFLFILSSCDDLIHTYEVTVVKNLDPDDLAGGIKVLVVTESGDSVEAIVPEGLIFNNSLPFSAVMEKNELAKFGYIKDTSSNNTFDVTVIGLTDFDNFVGRQKVIAVTKSGVSVESWISEEILLKNKIPFLAVMEKDEIAKCGIIK